MKSLTSLHVMENKFTARVILVDACVIIHKQLVERAKNKTV